MHAKPLLRAVAFTLLAAGAASASPPTPVPAPADPQQAADQAFDRQDWATAATAYEALSRSAPTVPRHFMRLGLSRHQQKRWPEAVAAYERAIALKAPASPTAHYNLACILAAQPSERARAWEHLEAAAGSGSIPAATLQQDPDLAPLRSDRRFAALVATAEARQYPCRQAPEYHQLDFWLGRWEVLAGTKPAGESHIERAADGCLVVEHWRGASGHSGKSLNFYLPRERRWRQTWVGSDGDVIEFSGQLVDGELRFSANGWASDGKPTVRRLTFAPLTASRPGPRKVRQLGELSEDGGRTFRVEYDLLYVERANDPTPKSKDTP